MKNFTFIISGANNKEHIAMLLFALNLLEGFSELHYI
jgi:hypothetical protein